MATVSFRVPDDLKERMEEADINWSEFFRDAAEERLRRTRRQEAAREMDRLRETVYRRTGKYSNMSQEIVRWRRLH